MNVENVLPRCVHDVQRQLLPVNQPAYVAHKEANALPENQKGAMHVPCYETVGYERIEPPEGRDEVRD